MFDPYEFYEISKHLYRNFDDNEALLRTLLVEHTILSTWSAENGSVIILILMSIKKRRKRGFPSILS